MGLAFLWGGLRFQEQEFNRTQVGSNSSLLLLAVIALIIPTVFHASATNSSDDSVLQLSRIVSLILLAIYGLFLLFQLKTHASLFATDGAHHESPSMEKRDAAILLVVATILVSFMAEILVHSLEDAAEELHIPHLFIGIILLPLFGNAAEHFTAVTVAGKNKMDLSFAISVGSSTQHRSVHRSTDRLGILGHRRPRDFRIRSAGDNIRFPCGAHREYGCCRWQVELAGGHHAARNIRRSSRRLPDVRVGPNLIHGSATPNMEEDWWGGDESQDPASSAPKEIVISGPGGSGTYSQEVSIRYRRTAKTAFGDKSMKRTHAQQSK